MTIKVDPNIQRLADAANGVDRTKDSTKLNTDGLGHKMLSDGSFAFLNPYIGGATMVYQVVTGDNNPWIMPAGAVASVAGAKYLKPYWGALQNWRKDPLCDSFSKGLEKYRFEQNILKQNKRFLSYDAAGNKYSLGERYMNHTRYAHIDAMYNKLPSLEEPDDLSKLSAKKQAKLANNKIMNKELENVRALLDDVKKGKIPAKDLKAHYGKIIKELQAADIRINELRANGTLKATGKIGRAFQKLKQTTGYYKAKGFVLKSPTGFKFLKAMGKFGKGAGVFAAIGAVCSEAGNVMVAKRIDDFERSQGRKSNRMKKQIAKSAVVAGATVAGSALAAAGAGAVVGTAVCPVIGTAIGFVAGAIGGLIGGWLGKKVTGKSEAEKYQEEQAKKQAEEASKNTDAKDELLAGLWQAKEAGELTDEGIIKILEEEINARELEIQETNTSVEQLSNMGRIDYAA